jgi:hypothetical protein
MVLSKVRKEIGKAKMKAEVEINRSANIQWLMANQSDLIDNYPNRWAAIGTGISGPAVQYVDIELFEVFKVMSMRDSSSATIYYLCNTYQPPVLLMAPPEVWTNDSV